MGNNKSIDIVEEVIIIEELGVPQFDDIFPKLNQVLKDFPKLVPLDKTIAYCAKSSIDLHLRRKHLYKFMGSVK